VTKIPPPLLGYNNNVRYRGRTFHIQTEDSGTKYARIVTHLFVDGGRIVKSIRTQYSDVLGSVDMAETIRRMMKDQHKAMFLSLRAGEFDEAIAKITGPAELTITPMPLSIEPQSVRSDALASTAFATIEAPSDGTSPPGSLSAAPLSASARQILPSAPSPSAPASRGASMTGRASEAHFGTATVERAAEPRPSSRPHRARSSAPPSPRRPRVVDDPTPVEYLPPTAPTLVVRPSERPPRAPQSRPLAGQTEVIDPRAQSIFGEAGEGRQTLDEVILSFLEEEES
jgi:hypothetical protein